MDVVEDIQFRFLDDFFLVRVLAVDLDLDFNFVGFLVLLVVEALIDVDDFVLFLVLVSAAFVVLSLVAYKTHADGELVEVYDEKEGYERPPKR